MYTNNAYPSSNDGYTYNNNNNIMNNTTTSNGSAESQVQFSLAKKKSLNPPLNGFDQGNGSQVFLLLSNLSSILLKLN